MPRRFTARHVTVGLTALSVLALGACQQPPVVPSPVTSTLSDSAWPDVDLELDPDLVAESAHRLITRYLATTDTITRDGGEGASAMAGLTTRSWFPTEDAAFAHYRAENLRTLGDTVFDSLVIQSVGEPVTGGIHVDAFACVDASGVWLLSRDDPDPPEGFMEWWHNPENASEVPEEEFAVWSHYADSVQPIPGKREAIVFWLVGETLGSLAIDGTVNWEGADPCHTTATD
jgi:hypothetical protein